MVMIHRISQLNPKIVELAKNSRFKVKEERGTINFFKKKFVAVLDWREATGPVTKNFLEKWTKRYSSTDQIILITMGYFTAKALGYVLTNRKLRKKVSLIELGLRDYVEEDFKPRLFSMLKNELIIEISFLMENMGLNFSSFLCSFCNKHVSVCCSTCNSLLCRTHKTICPICKEHFCHPDLINKNCSFKHKCKTE